MKRISIIFGIFSAYFNVKEKARQARLSDILRSKVLNLNIILRSNFILTSIGKVNSSLLKTGI